MVVGVFPALKLGVLFVKQISKPLAKFLVNQAKNHPVFRTYFIIPPAQFYHWAEVKAKIVAGGCLILEYNRQVAKEAKKEEARLQQIQTFTNEIENLNKITLQQKSEIQYLHEAVNELAKHTKYKLTTKPVVKEINEQVEKAYVDENQNNVKNNEKVSIINRALVYYENNVKPDKFS
ncbi:Putative OPA3-like protein CG13603 [Anthophora quadrimaculata]